MAEISHLPFRNYLSLSEFICVGASSKEKTEVPDASAIRNRTFKRE
jgi:hypothetical protein